MVFGLLGIKGDALDPWGKRIMAVWVVTMCVLAGGVAVAVARDAGGITDAPAAYETAPPLSPAQ
jgi:hypothetical protein